MKKVPRKQIERLIELAAQRRELTQTKTQADQILAETRDEFQSLIVKCWDDPAVKETLTLPSGEEVNICMAPGKNSCSMDRFVVQLTQRGVSTKVINDAQAAATIQGESYPVMMPVRRKREEAE